VKVVYNAQHGGFGLSPAAVALLLERAPGIQWNRMGARYPQDGLRHHPELVRVVQELGVAANGQFADLRVHHLRGVHYIIDEYDGFEEVMEPDDIEWIDATSPAPKPAT
jgi:hypothetical protein